MDLWIRSQDKSALVKVKSVLMLNKEIRGYYNENPNWLLGKYDTEERALEVLDEINKFKDFFQFVDLLPNNKKWEYLSKINFKDGDTLTYEMPKE